jgi:hypothetical protein
METEKHGTYICSLYQNRNGAKERIDLKLKVGIDNSCRWSYTITPHLLGEKRAPALKNSTINEISIHACRAISLIIQINSLEFDRTNSPNITKARRLKDNLLTKLRTVTKLRTGETLKPISIELDGTTLSA